jgi:hypothetical protein
MPGPSQMSRVAGYAVLGLAALQAVIFLTHAEESRYQVMAGAALIFVAAVVVALLAFRALGKPRQPKPKSDKGP